MQQKRKSRRDEEEEEEEEDSSDDDDSNDSVIMVREPARDTEDPVAAASSHIAANMPGQSHHAAACGLLCRGPSWPLVCSLPAAPKPSILPGTYMSKYIVIVVSRHSRG